MRVDLSDEMKRWAEIGMQVMCWGVILFCVADATRSALTTRQFLADVATGKVFGYCGNSVTEPLCLVLNIQAPLVIAAFYGLFHLGQQTRSRTILLVFVGTVCAAGLLGFIVFGHDFFTNELADRRLFYEVVWWLKPAAWLCSSW